MIMSDRSNLKKFEGKNNLSYKNCDPGTTDKRKERNKNVFKDLGAAHPEFVFDTGEVILLGLQISQREVESLACVIFIRNRGLDKKHSAVFTADKYALWSLGKNENITL